MRRPAGRTALGFTPGAAKPVGCQAGSAASLPLESPLGPSVFTGVFSPCFSGSRGLLLAASASLCPPLRRLPRSCKELPLWRCWGPVGFADVSATDAGDETPESRRACSPHALGPAAFKVPAAPAFPPSLGPGKGTTATISSSPHALLWKPRRPVSEVSFYCLSVASSGTAAAPAPGVERGTEERAEGPLRHGLRDYWR